MFLVLFVGLFVVLKLRVLGVVGWEYLCVILVVYYYVSNVIGLWFVSFEVFDVFDNVLGNLVYWLFGCLF